jgi:hypothetical protein
MKVARTVIVMILTLNPKKMNKEHLLTQAVETLNEFEKEYLSKMLMVRDGMDAKYSNGYPTPEAEKEHNQHKSKCHFLERMIDANRRTISYGAVLEKSISDFMQTIETARILKNGNIREVLFEQQRTQLNNAIDKLKQSISAE